MIKEHDTYYYNTVFTQKDAEVYAKLTDDYNPIHIDREYATATEFGRPVAQGVLILCAFAKVFGTMWPADKLAYFMSADKVKFRKPVVPGDRLELHCSNIRRRMQLCKMDAKALVDGKLAAEAQISAAIADRP